MNIVIRKAETKDLPEIAKVHINCFSDSFSTALGNNRGGVLLISYYKEYLDANPDLFLVSEVDGRICGFCMGYLVGDKNFGKSYLMHNFTSITIQMIKLIMSGNAVARDKVKHFLPGKSKETVEFIDEDFESIKANQKVDLLSICVLPEFRGSGIASNLIQEYQKVGALLRREYCVLTVKTNNDRAIAFYKKQGFVIRKRTNEKFSLIKRI